MLPELAKAVEDGFPGIRPKGRESEIVELVLHRLHADALGQRRVYLLGLARDPPPFFRLLDVLQGAHVVQAVGELDHQHPDVVGHREQQLSEILGLGVLDRLQLELGELGHPVDQPRDFLAEQVLDILDGGAGVLDGVVQERRRDRGAVEAELGQNAGDLDRMREIEIARRPDLGAMRLHRENISAIQKVFVDIGIIGSNQLDQFELPHDLAARLRACRRCAGCHLRGKRLLYRFQDQAYCPSSVSRPPAVRRQTNRPPPPSSSVPSSDRPAPTSRHPR